MLSTSPEHVAEKIIAAIYHDRRMVVITPVAHFLYALQRFAPGVIDFLQRLGRRRRMARKSLPGGEAAESAPLSTSFTPGDAASDASGPPSIPFRFPLDSVGRSVGKAA